MATNPLSLRMYRKYMVKLLELIVCIIMGLLVLDVLWGVFTRYLIGSQSRWTEELAQILLIWVALLGASVALGKRQHLGVDYFVGKLEPSAQKLVFVIVHLIVLFFACTIFIMGGWQLVREVLAVNQQLISMPFSKAWVYAVLPISGVFMCLFTIEHMIETFTIKSEAQ